LGDGEGRGSKDDEAKKTGLLMRKWATLRGKEGDLVKDLKKTTLPYGKLGKKYGYRDRRSQRTNQKGNSK